MKTPEFPKVIKRGSVSVTIYETPTKGYISYTIVYYQNGQRKRETNADYTAILNRAREILGDLETGRESSASLSGAERETYSRALKSLAVTGQPLDVAVSHYAQAVKILGGDLVIEAAREYAKRHGNQIKPKLVQEVVDEFLVRREDQKRSDRHLETLASHCKRFASAMQKNIGSVITDDVDKFLDGLNVGARTRDNFLGSLNNLFEFAKSKQYLPKEHDELSRVARLDNQEDGPIEIYTADELTALLKNADWQLVPFLAIGAFAGLRSSEIERLDWSDVKFDSDCIIVQKGKVKKRGKSRRIVPMASNLKAILKPFAQASGKIWPHTHPYLYEQLRATAARAEIKLKNNALRHSFVSYRVAMIKNVPQVALESGNSPQMIDSNYRELVTENEAKAWFAIEPEELQAAKTKVMTNPPHLKAEKRRAA
jgi:integrase